MIEKLLPKSKSDWIVVTGFILAFLADIVHSYYSFDPMNATPKVASIEWLIRVVRDWSLTAAIATLIIAGIRRIRTEGFALKRLLSPLIGILMASGYLCVSLFGYQTFTSIEDLDKTSGSLCKKVESSINSGDLRPGEKAKRSKLCASMRFNQDGVVINYFTLEGKTELYTPTEKEKKERAELVKSKKLVKWMAKSLYSAIYFWIAVIAVSLALGILTPVKRKPHNNGVDTDTADPAAQVTP